jgi:response regulator of citrate/malate metabolism
MGIIFDILKEIPLSANLSEKIKTFEARNGELETENTILQKKLDKAELQIKQLETEITQLKNTVERFTKITPEPNDVELQIITLLAQQNTQYSSNFLSEMLHIHPTKCDFHLAQLVQKGYVNEIHYPYEINDFALTDEGKEYAVMNNII